MTESANVEAMAGAPVTEMEVGKKSKESRLMTFALMVPLILLAWMFIAAERSEGAVFTSQPPVRGDFRRQAKLEFQIISGCLWALRVCRIQAQHRPQMVEVLSENEHDSRRCSRRQL